MNHPTIVLRIAFGMANNDGDICLQSMHALGRTAKAHLATTRKGIPQ